MNKNWKKKLTKLFNSRVKLSKQKFLNDMKLKGYNLLLSEVIYDKIYNYLPKSLEKNIYPEDNVLIDYDIDDEDLGDILIECFSQKKIEFPNRFKQDKFYKKFGNEITVERLIQFIIFFSDNKSKE